MATLPPPVKDARFALIGLAILVGVFFLVCLLVTIGLGLDGFRAIALVVLGYLSAGTTLSAIGITHGKKWGKTLLWFVLPIIVLSFPIGTLLGIYIAIKMEKPEAKAFFECGAIPPILESVHFK